MHSVYVVFSNQSIIWGFTVHLYENKFANVIKI